MSHKRDVDIQGLPLGNLTSQLFANIYLNEPDQFIKMTLRAKYYMRYCDDFVILDRDRELLSSYIGKVGEFLNADLKIAHRAMGNGKENHLIFRPISGIINAIT